MKIFKDVLTGAEVVCDNDRPFDVEDDIVYKIPGRYIDVGGEDYGISANVDDDAGEGATGEVADGKQRVVDVVYTNRYTETSYDKASYMAHIKTYMKALLERIEDADAKKAFQTNAQTFVKKVLKEIDDYQFFIPEGNEEDPDSGMIVLCKWEGETPIFYLWKDGLNGTRV
ncbi:IgE-dependent histamine-releasing factor [Angomonas deanei]|uniref:Translationally controlled tumour protein, putative n=1 Tax=Angomonas deanei TaxID=59799 RepID=S9VBV4_9TRYP|nr:IgE-dependent histamine-releasing factor [Angomonas deanei]EPY38469.1 IgE-dependent histamine-releasing factor [Angomonas deanei]EPY39625.1 IgE-dependent histamine-releasing factor [Angomonas deanei]EPY40475.1 IgE-dependent histamine-releasing factor [Angomonas deanei]CAD2219832.1 Translationally controlled tumour protein, putative [Angomonas deanei]|eukprot:EPY36912.1 IgE-dependent histamine-releasing factor [Angomonas deanei]